MIKTGIEDDLFSSFKILTTVFNDYDILFIKDIKPFYWYLTIINDVYDLIHNIVESNNYKFMYGLTSSSGTLCLLTTLYKFDIFTKSVIIVGQTTLCDDIVNKYKYQPIFDCCIFDKQLIAEKYDHDLLTPFDKIPHEIFHKYVFYYCNSITDVIYYEYIKSIYPNYLHSNIMFDTTHISHAGYAGYLLNDHTFLTNIKTMYDSFT
jgi:hypothetical protein